MRENSDEKHSENLPVYESHPPAWLPKVHATADLGYVGFHPPRPGQDEDSLSENNVKNGFILGQPVAVEAFSAQAMINESLHSIDTLSKLERLMNDVFIHRADRIPIIPPSTFRIPMRVTLNDAKRQAWFADLANPDVPLHKLGKSVPHGAKGHDLLDLLHSNNVAIPRAVWFLRVFGANETAGLRNKPTYIPTQYSVDWANVVTGYMKKQLVEIALPSAPRLGLNIKQTFKGVLADTDTRDRWMSRFTYCLKLLRTFYAEDLIDHKTFLTWLVQQMITCNLAQAGFLTPLSDEYLDDIMVSRALTRPLVESCLNKLFEIRSTSAHDFLKVTEQLLKLLIQRVCLALPDALVSPKLWNSYSMLLDEIVFEGSASLPHDRYMEQNITDLRYLLSENLSDARERNRALSFYGPITQPSDRLGTAVSDVKLLNSISGDTDMNSITYFREDINDPSFKEKLDMLLTWSVTPLQYGDHRPFAAVTLICIWRNKAHARASKRAITKPNDFLQDQLFDWLDTSEIAGEANSIRDVALLYGKLVKHEIFSYSAYIQRLIARGEPGVCYAEEPASRHRQILNWIPLFKSSSSLINQRKVTLHGARARETPEDVAEREIRKEIRAVLPELFGVAAISKQTSTTLSERCKRLMAATRFEQVRTFRQWLLPFFKTCFLRTDVDGSVLLKSYLVVTELMTFTKCFHSMLDLTLSMLEHCVDAESMDSLLNTFCRHITIWNCMNVMPAIVKALDTAHQVWKLRGVQCRPLLALIMRFDNSRHLSEASRERIESDLAAFTLALRPIVEHAEPIPDLSELLDLLNDDDPNAPSAYANRLWIKYRTSLDWASKVWDSTVTTLRHISEKAFDTEIRRNCALRCGAFLWKVDQHLPNGIDGDVLQWLVGPGRVVVASLNAATWDVLAFVLIYLVVHGALKTTTILRGLIYPAWHMGAGTANQPLISETHLSAANVLCSRLLLGKAESDEMPLFDAQSIRTKRQEVYDEPHFSLLVSSIPTLISLEINKELPESLRLESTSLRCQLCQESGFRQGAYRNLDIIREAFENSPYLIDEDPTSENLSKRAIAGLRMILCDSTDEANIYDWPEVTCLLSPWKIAATTVQMQLQVKKLGRALSQESTSEFATTNLNKLISMLFHHTKTAEEAYYVGEMARGTDTNVASKFINRGFQCMIDLFTEHPSNSTTSVQECFQRVGELLRVLVHISLTFRDSPASSLIVEPQVQDAFIATLENKFKAIEPQALSENNMDSLLLNQQLVLLSRLLQFVLSFRCCWTPQSKDACINLSALLFRLTLRFAIEDNSGMNNYSILIDTLLVLFDELSHDSKSITFDPFRYYPNYTATDIPTDIPPHRRKQIISLLAHLLPASAVTNLVNAHRDSQGNTVYGTPVVNKPWEWIENLGEPSAVDPKDEEKERLHLRYLVKNSGSLSLDTFGARITGDGVKQEMLNEGGQLEGYLRPFEDGMSENVFIRDWRETRWDTEPLSEATIRLRSEHESGAFAGSESSTAHTLRASPSSSVISHSSTQATGSSRQQPSPAQAVRSRPEVIDLDVVQVSSGSVKGKETMKRKASAMTISDDEIEIIEGPVIVRTNTTTKKQKAGKAPAAGKSRGRKK
ncbi:hypothetical protein M413DRAFT_441761 [Hebeloma cylindrosporum]|uniref:Mediator of RNA polymerase II transcription subunit 12 n=1 Tax=Hebeloma cylindrosporum TaxID=76867 RepID=A0A0C3CMY2_HEBCY|nr:hypothetical protein M413DRAFT_441761 [Hebeloma cylindrosporum h7]